jgi:hypothetical protein
MQQHPTKGRITFQALCVCAGCYLEHRLNEYGEPCPTEREAAPLLEAEGWRRTRRGWMCRRWRRRR